MFTGCLVKNIFTDKFCVKNCLTVRGTQSASIDLKEAEHHNGNAEH